uniref:Uncharacterized protein n=1 Tax=Coturnix japonica TaxID=93934 RepID=A0A8C2SX86_COTJA
MGLLGSPCRRRLLHGVRRVWGMETDPEVLTSTKCVVVAHCNLQAARSQGLLNTEPKAVSTQDQPRPLCASCSKAQEKCQRLGDVHGEGRILSGHHKMRGCKIDSFP